MFSYLLYERVDILLVVTTIIITKKSCLVLDADGGSQVCTDQQCFQIVEMVKVGLYIMQRVFRGHGCEEKAIADGVAVGGQHG